MVTEKASPKFERSVVFEHIEEAMGTKLMEKVVLSLNKKQLNVEYCKYASYLSFLAEASRGFLSTVNMPVISQSLDSENNLCFYGIVGFIKNELSKIKSM